MRKHVQKIAEQLGYRPDATVASLMAQLRSKSAAKFQSTLGFLNASENPGILREIPTFQEWRGIRGLIVAALQNDGVLPATYKGLWSDFSCIVIGMRPKEPALHFAANDQFSTAHQAVEELRRQGCKRIGLVINPEIDAWLEHRFSAGFFAGEKGEERLPIFAFQKGNFAAFRDWYQTNQPDALVTLHAEIKSWLLRFDPKFPIHALAHLDREEGMNDWAGMNQNSYCIGVAATEMIVGQLHRNERGVPDFPKAVLVQSSWVNGATTRSQKNKKPRTRQHSRKTN